MVVLDKKDYLEKAQELLVQPAYRTMERDPTNKLKAKLITILRKIKREWMKNSKRLCTQQAAPPKLYGLPEIYKTGTPLGLLY